MEQIDRIAGLVRDVLKENAIGAYLHGSSILGGLGPHSDIDVLVVCSRGTTPEEKRALVRRLLAVSGPVDPSVGRRPVGHWAGSRRRIDRSWSERGPFAPAKRMRAGTTRGPPFGLMRTT